MDDASAGAGIDRVYDIADFLGAERQEPSDEEIDDLLRRAARLHLERFGSPPSPATSSNVFLWAAEHAYLDVCPKDRWGRIYPDVDRPPPSSPRRPPPPQRFVLYRLLGENGRTLYVGITRNFPARLRAHKRKWGPAIVSTRCEEYDDLESLMEAEAAAIRDERPPLNHDGVDEA